MGSSPVQKTSAGPAVSGGIDKPLLEPYVVRRGDRFDALAAEAGLSPADLGRFNKHLKDRDWIVADETVIYIPADRLAAMLERREQAAAQRASKRTKAAEQQSAPTAPRDSVVASTPTLRAGSSGAEVVALKRALATLGVLQWNEATDPAPERFDSETAKALWEYQGSDRFSLRQRTPNGALDAATRGALRRDLGLPKGSGPLHATQIPALASVAPATSFALAGGALQAPASGSGVELRPATIMERLGLPMAAPSVPPPEQAPAAAPPDRGGAQSATTTSAQARSLDVVERPKTKLVAGREGREVSMLERMMNRLGADVKVDGDFGPALQREVIQWQKELVRELGIDDKTKAGRKELARRGWHYGVVNQEQWELLLRRAAAVSAPDPGVATFPPVETVASGSERRAYEILHVLALESPRDFRELVALLKGASPKSTAPVVVDAALIGELVRATELAGLSLTDDVERDLARLSFRSEGGIGFNGARAVMSLLHEVLVLKRPPISNKYEQEIRAVVGDDPELYKLVRALIMQESNYNPKIRSPKGATGLMQIMPDTARSLDPKLKGKSDEEVVRYLEDPAKNIRMGVRYLKSLLEKFGHWHLALAAYNWGENRDSLLAFRDGKTDEVSAVARAPSETQNYMQKVLRNAAFYGHAARPEATRVAQAAAKPVTRRERDGI